MDKQNTQIYFEEIQHFRQPWIWILALPISIIGIGFFVYLMYEQLVLGQPVGNRPMPNDTLIWFDPLMLIILLSIPVLLYFSKLKIQIDDRAIHVHFNPFFKRQILLEEITEWRARKYKPFLEYGGWGIRWGPGGKAYNVSGSWGVQLKFTNGKKLLIGSQRADEFAAAISRAKSH